MESARICTQKPSKESKKERGDDDEAEDGSEISLRLRMHERNGSAEMAETLSDREKRGGEEEK